MKTAETISERELFAEFLRTEYPIHDIMGRVTGTVSPQWMITDYGESGTLVGATESWPDEIGSDDYPLVEIDARLSDLELALGEMKRVRDMFAELMSLRRADGAEGEEDRYSAKVSESFRAVSGSTNDPTLAAAIKSGIELGTANSGGNAGFIEMTEEDVASIRGAR